MDRIARKRRGIIGVYWGKFRPLDQFELAEVIAWRETASLHGFTYSEALP